MGVARGALGSLKSPAAASPPARVKRASRGAAPLLLFGGLLGVRLLDA